jgi:epsilon-lactone hydrolase
MTIEEILPAIRSSTYPTPPDLEARRNGAGAVEGPASAPGITVAERRIAGVECFVCEAADSHGCALYFHGGGYRLGSAARSVPFATRIAAATNHTIVVVEYRLAPEHPFPAGLTDAVSVYTSLMGEHDEIGAIGDSAGGGLAAALFVAASIGGVRAPSYLALMSPWLDLTCTAGTYATRAATDALFSLDSARQASAMYLQGHDPADPLASPVLAELDSWPPTVIFASTEEVLLEDSISFSRRLALSGTPVAAFYDTGVPHAWPAVFPDLPASERAVERIAAFLAAQATRSEKPSG